MTDLWELTGPQPSDPCGVEGTPPNLSELEVSTEVTWEWTKVGVGPLALPVYLPTSCEMNVTVRARDNVGVQWVRFHVEGKGEQEVRFDRATNNTTATATFDHDFWRRYVSGYELNITVSDVNGNEGYLEQHINSVAENFVAWVLGQVTALAEFVMELASSAIEWIWAAIENNVKSVFNPIMKSSKEYVVSVFFSFYFALLNLNGTPSESNKNNISTSVFSPFFFTLFTIILVIILSIKIISYFTEVPADILIKRRSVHPASGDVGAARRPRDDR